MARPSRAAIAAAQAAAEAVAEAETERDSVLTMAAQADDIPADPDKIERDEEDLLAALRELDTGSDIEWSVHKISGAPDERGFIEKLASQQLSLQYFRDKYGPGEYKVLGRRGGYYVKGGYKQVKISTVGYEPRGLPQEGMSIKEILGAIDAKKAETREELKSWAALLLPVATPLLQSFLQPRNQVKELLEGLAALKGITPEPKEPESLSKQLDTIAGVMGRLKELSGAGDDKPVGSNIIDLVREAISGLKPVLEGVLAARVGAVPGMLPKSAPPALAVMPSAAPATGQENPMLAMIPWLRATLEGLILQASRDRDPALYAEVTLENLPDNVEPKALKEFIERPDWWQVLQNFDARVGPYVGWFTAFRREVLQLMKENDPPIAPPQDTDGGVEDI